MLSGLIITFNNILIIYALQPNIMYALQPILLIFFATRDLRRVVVVVVLTAAAGVAVPA